MDVVKICCRREQLRPQLIADHVLRLRPLFHGAGGCVDDRDVKTIMNIVIKLSIDLLRRGE
ncbi:MAG: hypothetical protein RR235_07925, partial [Oscillospiraceae bacterium]